MNLSVVIKWIEKIPALGIWCSVLSNTLFAFSYVMTKAVVNPDNVFVIGTIRMVIQYSILMPILAKDRIPLFGVKGERLNLFWCAVTYIAFHMSIIIAFSMIPAADATAIVAGFPVIVTLAGPCLLGEKFHKIFLFNAFLTIVGVILIDRPSFIFPSETKATTHVTGVVLAVGAMFWNSGTSIFSKKLARTSSYTCSTVYPFVTSWGFLLAVVITNQFVFPSCGIDAVVTVLSGVVHSIGTIIYFVAYKYEDAGPLSISGNVESPLVLLMEVLFLGSNPPWTTYAGMVLVVVGVVLTAVQKWDAAREAISKKLRCLGGRKKKLKVEDPVVFTISYQTKPQN